ncbi:MAG: Tudor-knot domain-containing protein [Polyangiaceae bacterium]
MRRVRLFLCVILLPCWLGCQEPYRVGEHVWVEWDGRDYPAYILAKRGRSRFRVHYDGYDARWDEDVTLDRIKGRVTGPATPPPPPDKVARASGVTPKAAASAGAPSPYKEGDKVRVRWRGSVYGATVIAVVSSEKILVHYDGHESAWDETISVDRVVSP